MTFAVIVDISHAGDWLLNNISQLCKLHALCLMMLT